MALQGEAKKLYHREYMRRRRAGLPTRGVVKPMVMEQWCSECVCPQSERIVISLGSGYRLCESCYEAAGALFAAERGGVGLPARSPQKRGADQTFPRETDKPAASSYRPVTEKAPPKRGLVSHSLSSKGGPASGG